MASSLPGEACQQGAVLHKRFENTGDGPAFACARTAPVDDSHTLCRVEDQAGQGDISDCCSSSFKTYYYAYALPWSTGRFHTDNQTADTVNAFQDRCPCKGLLLLQYGAWIVIDADAGRRSVDPEPWSVPFGRRRGWHDLLSRLIRPGSQLHTVIASTPHINHHMMTLEPPKDEWERWTYQALEWMAIVDKDIAQQYNFSYAPYYEVTRQFRHISCGACMSAFCAYRSAEVSACERFLHAWFVAGVAQSLTRVHCTARSRRRYALWKPGVQGVGLPRLFSRDRRRHAASAERHVQRAAVTYEIH